MDKLKALLARHGTPTVAEVVDAIADVPINDHPSNADVAEFLAWIQRATTAEARARSVAVAEKLGTIPHTLDNPWIHYRHYLAVMPPPVRAVIADRDPDSRNKAVDRFIRRTFELGLHARAAGVEGDQYPLMQSRLMGETAGAVGHYIDAGMQNFVVGPVMQEMLLSTSLRVSADSIRHPYGAYWVSLPHSRLKYRGRRVDGMYVVPAEPTETHMSVSVALFLADTTRPELLAEPHFADLITNMPIPRTLGVAGLEGHIRRAVQQPESVAFRSAFAALDGQEQNPDPDGLTDILRLVLSLCLYLSSEGRETDTGYAASVRKELDALAKNRRLSKVARKHAEAKLKAGQRIVWIGRSIEVIARQAASAGVPRRIHWVRGHWRVLHLGSASQKTVWVRPHERGTRDEDRVAERLYRLRKDTLRAP